MQGRVLIIAASDSSGGAGIQADIKAVTALKGYAMTAITALTAQNTVGVYGISGIDPEFLKKQIKACVEDIGVDAIKIGMLYNSDNIRAVAQCLRELPTKVPVVLDPVMMSKTGAKLMEDEAQRTLKIELLPLTTLLTPNIPEAETLAGMTVRSLEDMKNCAMMLHTTGPENILLKGGHLEGDKVVDVLSTPEGTIVLTNEKINSLHTHGTGCTLSSAIACCLARGMNMGKAVKVAHDYVHEAIRTAPGLGKGRGPLNHLHPIKDFAA